MNNNINSSYNNKNYFHFIFKEGILTNPNKKKRKNNQKIKNIFENTELKDNKIEYSEKKLNLKKRTFVNRTSLKKNEDKSKKIRLDYSSNNLNNYINSFQIYPEGTTQFTIYSFPKNISKSKEIPENPPSNNNQFYINNNNNNDTNESTIRFNINNLHTKNNHNVNNHLNLSQPHLSLQSLPSFKTFLEGLKLMDQNLKNAL